MRAEFTPEIQGNLRRHRISIPPSIGQVGGIRIFGRLIRSLVFSTDVAIIRNCNADAVIAVYPFTPQPAITHAIMQAADTPVFCGVGGGTTTGTPGGQSGPGRRTSGRAGRGWSNAPTENETIYRIRETLDIPIVVTVASDKTDFAARIAAGATIFNVSCAADTPRVVDAIRQKFPDFPIIATGGATEESILRTIDAGANAITYTPPSTGEIFRDMMIRYRQLEG